MAGSPKLTIAITIDLSLWRATSRGATALVKERRDIIFDAERQGPPCRIIASQLFFR